MGVINSKSPLERRNTVLRRSQRKSIHGTKGKTDKITKEIRKFKGIEEDSNYTDLKAKIEHLERELRNSEKNLQPQLRQIHRDALKRVEDCYKLLESKLQENREKAAKNKDEDSTNDDVFIEEIKEPEEKRRTVELKLVQLELNDSPKVDKRSSIVRMGVPVMPGSMMEALHRRVGSESGNEEKVAGIRKQIEQLELEISQFIGRKNGKYYNKIREQLDDYSNQLKRISSIDDEIYEQVKLCGNYIASCLSFLDEKALDEDSSVDEEIEEFPKLEQNSEAVDNLSPRTTRTTYI